MTCNKNKDL